MKRDIFMKAFIETPISKIKVRGSSEQITIPKNIKLDNNNVLLLKFPKENIYWVSKVCSYSYSNYIRLTSKLKERPKEIEIIKISKIGEKPKPVATMNNIDIVDTVGSDCSCMERPGGFITIYKVPKGPDVTIKRLVKIDEETSWFIGFYLAEGNKCDYGIGISNNELDLLKKCYRCLLRFGINNKDLFVYIHSSNNHDFEKIKKHMERTFRTQKIAKVKSRLATKDNIELRINSTLLSIIFRNFIKNTIKIILNDKKLIVPFLQGYEVGDGSILQRNGYLYGISITVKDSEIKNILIDAFQKLYNEKPRTRISKKAYEISYSNVNLMTEFILDKHFYTSQRQWRKLIKTYLKKQYVRSHTRYWNGLEGKELSVEELSKSTNRSHWSVRDAMNRDARFKLIEIKQKKILNRRGPPYNFYSLTEKGKELLDLIGGVS